MKNARVDVTGMLLYHGRTFFQVLEGDRGVVEPLFDRIGKDKRHDRYSPPDCKVDWQTTERPIS